MVLKPIKTKSTKVYGTERPIWDLYRDGLTQGSICKYLECPEQFRLGVALGWGRKMFSEPMEFGSMGHHALAEYHTKGIDFGVSLNAYTNRRKDEGGLTVQDYEKMELLSGQVEIILRAYHDNWHPKDSKKEWIHREKVFTFYTHPQLGYVTTKRIPITGRIDGAYREGKKSCYLFETKFKGQIDVDSIQDALPFNIQTMTYCTALLEEGHTPGGVMYDMVRRPLLRQGKTESMVAFLQRLEEDVAARPEHYFHRIEVVFEKDDLKRWREWQLNRILDVIRTWYEKTDMSNPWDSPFHYMNPESLFTRYGKCDLFAAITRGDFSGLVRRKIPFPELVD